MASSRLALVAVVLASDLLLTGLVFGWAPLLLLLKSEGQYLELCDFEEDDSDDTINAGCVAQENRLNLMFALASVAMNAGALPIGVCLDRFGPRLTVAGAAAVEIGGLVLLALADSQTFDVFVPAYLLIALGGCVTMMASFPASFLLLQYQTAILAAVSCLFDGSSVVFLVLYTVHEQTGATRKQLFLGLAVVAGVIYALLVALWGANEQHLKPQDGEKPEWPLDEVQVIDPLLHSGFHSPSRVQQQHKSPSANATGESSANTESYGAVDGWKTHPSEVALDLDTPLAEAGMATQMRSFEFAYILTFAAVQVLRATIYIGTANKLLDNYGDAEYGFLYTKIFSVMLPVGFVFVPAIDYLVETRGLALALLFTTVLGALYSLLTLVPSLPLQTLTVFVFTAFRAFLYAVMSAFTAKTFGLPHLGSLMGVIFSISSVVSLAEYPAVYASNAWFDGDLTALNALSLLLCLALLPLTAWLRRYEHQREKQRRQRMRARSDSLRGRQVYSTLLDTPTQGLTYLRSPGVTASVGDQLKFAQPSEGHSHE